MALSKKFQSINAQMEYWSLKFAVKFSSKLIRFSRIKICHKKKYAFVVVAPHAWTGHLRRAAEVMISNSGLGARLYVYCANSETLKVVRKWKQSNGFSNVRISRLWFPPSMYSAEFAFVSHGMPTSENSPKIQASKVIMLWHGISAKGHEKVWSEPPKHWISSGPWESSLLSTQADIPLMNLSELGSLRTDYLLCTQENLPSDHQLEIQTIVESKGQRFLVLFAPTFDTYMDNPQLFVEDCEVLSQLLKQWNVALGVRPHPDLAKKLTLNLEQEIPGLISFDPKNWPNTEPLIRGSDLLITDYSSIWTDFITTSKPMISVKGSSLKNSRDIGLSDLFPGNKFNSLTELSLFARSFSNFEDLIEQIKESSEMKYEETLNILYGNNLDGKVGERFLKLLE